MGKKGSVKITKTYAIIIALIVVVAVAGIGYWVYTTYFVKPPLEEIKIGLIFPLSGAWAPLGTDQYTGALIAIEMVNEKYGGVKGIPIKPVTADMKSDPTVGASEVERLITIEKVPVIIGSYASPALLAQSEVAERYKVIYWEVGAITDKATLREFKYLFRNQPIGGDFGILAVIFLNEVVCPKLGVDPKDLKVAIIHEDGPYGTSVADANEKYIKEYGYNLVGRIPYDRTTEDLSWLILKLKEWEPDVILATQYFGDTILFFKQAKELGLKVKAIVGHGAGYGLPATWKELGADINYIFNIDPVPPAGMNLEGLNPELRPIVEEFISRFEEKMGYTPMTHAFMGFANSWPLLTKVLPRALEKYGEITPDTIRKAALELNLPEGATPMGYGLKFAAPESPEDTIIGKKVDRGSPHIGQNIRSYPVVMQWKDGMLYVVYPEHIALMDAVIPLPPESPYGVPSSSAAAD